MFFPDWQSTMEKALLMDGVGNRPQGVADRAMTLQLVGL